VNLLALLAQRAQHDCVLVSDSNVRARPRYLRDTARELADPRVGLVTNLPACTDASGAGSLLELLHLNTWVAAAVSAARVAAGRACVIGKSMLFRLSDFESLGGFGAVRNALAEDYLIGRAFEQAGFRVALSPHVVEATTRGWTLERFANRHLRWAQMRRRLCAAAYAGEILLNPVAWIALALAAALRAGLDSRAVACAFVGVAVKAAADAAVSRRLGTRLHPAHLLAIPVKDLLVACIWIAGAFRRTVDWRGNRMRIGSGTELSPLGPDELFAPQEAA
jgi:ceramide glucosyltransferase